MTPFRKIHVAILVLIVLLSAQATGRTCEDMVYENRNQIDYGRPVRITAFRGTVKDGQDVPIPKACIGLFSEPGHKLVAATETDDNGEFDLKWISKGDYRLVAKYNGFCPANALVRLGGSRRAKPLSVHMRPAGIDTCSYIDQK